MRGPLLPQIVAMVRRHQSVLLATWFIALSAGRIAADLPDPPGFDTRLYRAATASWLAGGNPWAVDRAGVYFGAPPPSMLPFIPLVAVPEDVAVGIVIGFGLLLSVWALRRLRLGLWWLAFPPLVDAVWNANSQLFLLPLVLLGLDPIATLIKVYAIAVPAVGLDVRRTAAAIALLVVTIPVLPWASFVAQFPTISAHLAEQSRGGMSVTAVTGWLAVAALLVAAIALFSVGRSRAKWLVIPVLWPSTQWYYGSIAIPALTPLAAAVFALPVVLAPLLGTLVLSAQLLIRRRNRALASEERVA